MLIEKFYYLISFWLIIFSLFSLVYSITNDNSSNCSKIITVNVFYILYLISFYFIVGYLHIPYGFEMLFIVFLGVGAVILYIISIVINMLKRAKSIDYQNSIIINFIIIVLILLPIFSFSLSYFYNRTIINKSKILLVFYSAGNGGIGDGKSYAYAIGNNDCKQFDLGIGSNGIYLRNYLPQNYNEINNLEELTDYKIVFDENDYFVVYKNNRELCKVKNKDNYYNIDFEKGFMVNYQ